MIALNIVPNQLGTFGVDHQTGASHWSQVIKRLFGFDPDTEIDFDKILYALIPADRGAVFSAIAAALCPDGPEHFALEPRVRWPDGSIHRIFLIAHTQHRHDQDHGALCTIGVAGDITCTKVAELDEEMTRSVV